MPRIARNSCIKRLVAHTLLGSLLASSPSGAQTITEIIDGSGDGLGNSLFVANAIAVDADGSVYVAGANSDNVFRVAADGTTTEVIDDAGDRAGNPLDLVRGIAVDDSGNVYVAAQFSNNAFRIDVPRDCSTGGTPCSITELIDDAGDGAGRTLDGAREIAVDRDGNVYVVGEGSHNAFQITTAGVITEIIDATGDGAGHPLELPQDVEVDESGDVYVMGHFSDNVFRIDRPSGCSTSGVPCTMTELIDASGDGAGRGLRGPRDIAVDGADNLYVTGDISDNAFQVTSAGAVAEIIDTSGDGNPLEAASGVAVDDDGNVYVAGLDSSNVFRIDVPGTCSTSARPCIITQLIDATGDGAGNPLDGVVKLAVDAASTVYVAGFRSSNAFEIREPDTTPPDVVAALEPTLPRAPQSAASACSPTSARRFRVLCDVTDDTDPAPDVTAMLLAEQVDVPAVGVCSPRVDEVAVACDEVVEIRLLAPACPARPRSPHSSRSVDSRGRTVVFAERVTLEVTATDAAGNTGRSTFDPATEPSLLCDEVLGDGTCCPAIGQPAAGVCKQPVCGPAPP